MYSPKEFIITDQVEIKSIIDQNPFAILISNNEDQLISHLPINYFENKKLGGHLAKNNPQTSIPSDCEVTAVFTGPHAYVSPNDYASEFNVPTWNYVTIHCKGTISFVTDEDEMWSCFKEMVQLYEGATGWALPDEENYKKLASAIRFFYIENIVFEAKAKFNQNKSKEDIVSVISSFEKMGKLDVAKYMAHINKL